jgi:AbiU2
MSEYKKYYAEFSQNVAFAVRTWHHNLYLNSRASDDDALHKALNRAPRYWLDQRYSALQTTIIFLGKIFDKDGRAHSVDKTIKAAREQRGHFGRKKLRERKIEIGGEFNGIDEYIENASELTIEDIEVISAEITKAKALWERIRPLRDKVFAHNEILSEAESKTLFEAVKYADMSEILQILLNVSNAFWQAEFNGRKPDFSTQFTRPIEWAKKDIEELISSLLHQ